MIYGEKHIEAEVNLTLAFCVFHIILVVITLAIMIIFDIRIIKNQNESFGLSPGTLVNRVAGINGILFSSRHIPGSTPLIWTYRF